MSGNVRPLRALMSFHVWRGQLSGRYYCGKAHFIDNHWVSVGEKYDVTADVEALIEEAISQRNHPSNGGNK